MEKMFRKTVCSVKNCCLISHVYFCGITKTMTECIRKPGVELHRPAQNVCYYMTNKVEQYLPHCPLYEDHDYLEHFKGPIAIMINAVELMIFTAARRDCEIRSRLSN